MPFASPARGSAGFPRTSGANPPPTGPPIVPETNTHGPALTALGIFNGVPVDAGNQIVFFMRFSSARASCRVRFEVARQRARGHDAKHAIGRVSQQPEDGED